MKKRTKMVKIIDEDKTYYITLKEAKEFEKAMKENKWTFPKIIK